MVTAHLAVDISARCEAEGEGREQDRAEAVCCPASGSLESLQPTTDLASGRAPNLKADTDTQALRTQTSTLHSLPLPCFPSWFFPLLHFFFKQSPTFSSLPGSVALW